MSDGSDHADWGGLGNRDLIVLPTAAKGLFCDGSGLAYGGSVVYRAVLRGYTLMAAESCLISHLLVNLTERSNDLDIDGTGWTDEKNRTDGTDRTDGSEGTGECDQILAGIAAIGAGANLADGVGAGRFVGGGAGLLGGSARRFAGGDFSNCRSGTLGDLLSDQSENSGSCSSSSRDSRDCGSCA